MRLILLALALLPALAFAQSTPDVPFLGKIQNESGGQIILFLSDNNPQCAGSKAGLDVLSYNLEGKTLEGCWQNMSGTGLIKITWETGTTRVYPQASVVLHPTLQEEIEAEMDAEDAKKTSTGLDT